MRPKYVLVVFFNFSTAFYCLPRHPLCLKETLGATICWHNPILINLEQGVFWKYCKLTARFLGVFWKYSTLAARYLEVFWKYSTLAVRYPGVFLKYCTLVARYLGIFSKYSTLAARYQVEGQRDCMLGIDRVNALQCRLLMRNWRDQKWIRNDVDRDSW